MINLELYRTFIAIYREGTISKAAISIDVTQPAASQQLAMLEKRLEIRLFERTPRKMMPTDAGHELYTKISDSFDWIEQVSQDFILDDHKQTLFVIGVPLEFYQERLIHKLKALTFRCHFVFGTTVELSKSLEERQIDAMISTQKSTVPVTMQHEIFTEHFWLVAPKEMVVPKEYSRSWLIQQKWISYDARLSIIRRYFQMIYDIRPAISPILITPDLHAILKGVEAGVAMSVLPDYICKKSVDEGKIALVHKPEVPISNTLYFVYKSQRKDSVLVRQFLALFSE